MEGPLKFVAALIAAEEDHRRNGEDGVYVK